MEPLFLGAFSCFSIAYRKTNQRIAGNTAVPLAAEIISRVAPILGIMPEKHLNTAADSYSNGLISDISNLSNY